MNNFYSSNRKTSYKIWLKGKRNKKLYPADYNLFTAEDLWSDYY